MSEVSKFIPMEVYGKGMESEGKTIEMANANQNIGNEAGDSFRICGSSKNLPAQKTSFWAKLKQCLTYEIKLELTPYQQKVEDEINDFLHQEITWQGFKSFLFQDVSFGKKGKNN